MQDRRAQISAHGLLGLSSVQLLSDLNILSPLVWLVGCHWLIHEGMLTTDLGWEACAL